MTDEVAILDRNTLYCTADQAASSVLVVQRDMWLPGEMLMRLLADRASCV